MTHGEVSCQSYSLPTYLHQVTYCKTHYATCIRKERTPIWLHESEVSGTCAYLSPRPVFQVVVCAACEQTITAPCDAMFPSHNMQKVVPYASSNALDSSLSGDISSGHVQSSPASRKQAVQQPVPSSIRRGDSPTPEAFSPVASHGSHVWEHRNAAVSGWASPPCWGSPRTWGVTKSSSTRAPSSGAGSLAESVRQHHSSQESHNSSHLLCHLKNNAQPQHHYNGPPPPPPGKKSANSKLRTKPAAMQESSCEAPARQRDRKSEQRCNALRRMLADVLPVGFMPCVPLIKELPADLYGALRPRDGKPQNSTAMLQHQSNGDRCALSFC